MNAAIVAPSINARPDALAELRRIAPHALMIVVGDQKAPPELREFCVGIDAYYLGVEEQTKLPYKCASEIAWNSIMRRNLGYLESIRLGANTIISVDDDNHPISEDWYTDWAHLFNGEQVGTKIYSADGFFNIGDYADEKFHYRGYPYSLRNTWADRGQTMYRAQVGIANGLIYEDPDINAAERLEKNPIVTSYTRIAERGILLSPRETWSPINTQNTAYTKDLMPLAFALPGVGRYDDIWALYIAQRVMEATEYHVWFGYPAVEQRRNTHNLFTDLANELMGMQHTEAFCKCLKDAPIKPDASVVENLGIVAERLSQYWPHPFPHEFLKLWICDVEGLL